MKKARPLSKREKLILYIALVLFVCVLAFNFLLTPLIEKLTKINQEIEQKAFLLKRHYRLMRKGKNLLPQYENYKEKLEKGITSEELVATLFEEIEVSAKKFGVIIEKIKPQPIEEKEGYKEVSLEVELVGKLGPIFQFINKLENSPSFIKVSALRLLPQPRSSSQLRCRISLTKLFF
ncbi:MAG: type 4a pilus biogenesis protein PilO [Candidatus Omnitrophota bacterium]|nr:MAG: type 4a pilus biogenesis protein PilO [Candidatus Omnitrophota bacterium]